LDMLFNKKVSHSYGNSCCMPPMFVDCVFHSEGKDKVEFSRNPNAATDFTDLRRWVTQILGVDSVILLLGVFFFLFRFEPGILFIVQQQLGAIAFLVFGFCDFFDGRL